MYGKDNKEKSNPYEKDNLLDDVFLEKQKKKDLSWLKSPFLWICCFFIALPSAIMYTFSPREFGEFSRIPHQYVELVVFSMFGVAAFFLLLFIVNLIKKNMSNN